MAGRWRDPAAFRADPAAAPSIRPSARQSVALLAILVLVAGAIAVASALIRPDKARAFDLFHGSVFLGDSLAPVAVDLASGKPTVRLIEANNQVGAKDANHLAVTPVQDGTLLLNSSTGEFNMVDPTGFVIKTNGGVPLPKRTGATGAIGIASGALAFIEQTGPTGTSVYLVSQSTVQTAKIRAEVQPRAFRSMPEPGSTAPGNAASTSDNQLWLLLGQGARRTIRQLSVPADSQPGATLTAADHGTVDGAAAVATATTGSDGTGSSVVGVASSDRIQLFRAGVSIGTVRYKAQPGIDTVLPASNAEGRLSFLMHGTAGWSVVSVGADGTGVRGPTQLTGIAPGARLVAPAASRGSLYTMDTVGGQFVRIDDASKAGAITGASSYPLAKRNGKVIEPGGFADAYAIARGSRVIYNSPVHSNAMVLFTDGSHAPMSIEKSSAVSVNASGGAEALTRVQNGTGKPAPNGKTKPVPAAPINNKINCKTATQKPHIPTIIQATPGSRSVLLQWTYPLLDPQDCEPSTYTVNVKLLSNSAPSPPSSVTVQGQTSVNLAALFPSTQYEISVTAYINGQGTQSPPVRITTGPEGPAAPRTVRVRSDSAGDWNISWTSCGSVDKGCVPAATWKVIPQFCDGRGLSGAPNPLVVTADPTTAAQPPAQLKGGDALLGRGLRFQIEGTGEANTVGAPSAPTPCVFSWSRPVGSDIHVFASTPPRTTGQGTTSTDVSVQFSKNAVHDLGGVGGQLTYQLLDSNGATVTSQGPTTNTSVRLAGIRAGEHYTVAVTAQPPRHPEAAIHIPPVDVTAAIAVWPHPGVDATFTNTTFNQGKLTVTFSFPAGTPTHGETFDLINSRLQCGSTAMDLSRNGIAPGQTMTFENIDRFNFNSQGGATCAVTLQLSQNNATSLNPPLYGNGTSSDRVFSGSIPIDPPSSSTNASDFTATWAGDASNPQIVVSYHGQDNLELSSGWTITATNRTTADCGTSHDRLSSTAPATIAVDTGCITDGGTFTVSVDYTYIVSHPHFSDIPVSGSAPQPCQPFGFRASWGATRADGVSVTYTGDPSLLAGCSGFKYTVMQNDQSCGTDQSPSPPTPSVIQVSGCAIDPNGIWTVPITWTNDNTGQPDHVNPVIVLGPPPPN